MFIIPLKEEGGFPLQKGEKAKNWSIWGGKNMWKGKKRSSMAVSFPVGGGCIPTPKEKKCYTNRKQQEKKGKPARAARDVGS